MSRARSATSQPFLLALFAFSALLQTRATSDYNSTHSNDTLLWGPCEDYPAPLECALFQVPLDYAQTSLGSTNLTVIRLPAQTTPREGYMFFNPGGPGASGVELLGGEGAFLQAQLGSGWDVVSWDTRGVGHSGPDITLFDTYQEYDTFWNQLQGTGKFEAHGNLSEQADKDFFRAQAPAFDEFLKNFDDKYVGKSGDNLKYVGTCAVVRDLVGMVDAIYGPGLDVHYHGYSYGTIIGAYLTQMFPERIGSVILDGVVDAHLYTNELAMAGFPNDLQDVELALQRWTVGCAASSKCKLSSLGNGTAEGVMSIINEVLTTAYKTYDGTVWSQMGLMVNGTMPLDVHAWPYDLFSHYLYWYLYSASSWKKLDEHVVGLYTLQQNRTSLDARSSSARQINRAVTPSHWNVPGQWSDVQTSSAWAQAVYAIGCGDAQRPPSNYTTLDVFEKIIDTTDRVSRHFGTTPSPRWFCHRWTTRAVERLQDVPGIQTNFKIKPKNVVLVIGTTADTITPFSSARKLASKKRLGNKARLVQFDAIGHSSMSNNSTCINDIIHSYVRGVLPGDKGHDDPDVVCEVDSTPFDS